jgi:hypothetical protein
MGHSRVRAKVRRRKVAALAAYSRKFTVKNNTIPKSDKEFFMIPFSSKNVDTTGKYWFVPGVPGTMFIKHEKPNPETGNRYVMVDYSWEHKKYPQPKRLIKCKKKMKQKGNAVIPARNDFLQFKNFPYTLPKMNKIQYMEKLVEHKLAKWERKNPQPLNMFTEDVEKWKQERENMKERFRDFVVSIYDKLHLTGRFVVAKDSYTEEKVAEIKDVDGEGHKVNDLPKTSKLIKKAQKITNETKQKRPNLVATNLKDHKKQKGRIILPEAA